MRSYVPGQDSISVSLETSFFSYIFFKRFGDFELHSIFNCLCDEWKCCIIVAAYNILYVTYTNLKACLRMKRSIVWFDIFVDIFTSFIFFIGIMRHSLLYFFLLKIFFQLIKTFRLFLSFSFLRMKLNKTTHSKTVI